MNSYVLSLEVLEVDILWPRWVARIGVTRATEACFLTADRQCTELPLLRLPRLVHGFRGSDPMRQTRDLARVGWRGARCREGLCKKPIPVVRPTPPHRPRLADSFLAPGSGARGIPRVARPAIRRVAAMRRKEWGPRGTPRPAPSEGGWELRGPHGRLSSALPRGGGEQGGGGVGAVGRGLGFVWLILAFRGGASGRLAQWRPHDVFPSSLAAASRQRVERVEGPP